MCNQSFLIPHFILSIYLSIDWPRYGALFRVFFKTDAHLHSDNTSILFFSGGHVPQTNISHWKTLVSCEWFSAMYENMFFLPFLSLGGLFLTCFKICCFLVSCFCKNDWLYELSLTKAFDKAYFWENVRSQY